MVSSNRSCEENLNNFTCIINYALDTLTPLKAVVTNHNDRPWMNNNLRTLINKRQKAFAQGNQTLYKMLRNKVNRSRKRCRKLYYENKVKDMKHTKPKDWWGEVKRFCGLSMGTPDNIFANLEQDTQDPTVFSNLINDTFLEPMLNYPPLNDNVAVIYENDTPIVVYVEEVLSHL